MPLENHWKTDTIKQNYTGIFMNDTYKSLLALFLLPPLVILGHDIYIWYNEHQDFTLWQEFDFSDIGILFTLYAPDYYDTLQDMVTKETWKDKILPVMETNAVIGTGIPAAVLLVWSAIAKIFAVWPYQPETVRFSVRDKKKIIK